MAVWAIETKETDVQRLDAIVETGLKVLCLSYMRK